MDVCLSLFLSDLFYCNPFLRCIDGLYDGACVLYKFLNLDKLTLFVEVKRQTQRRITNEAELLQGTCLSKQMLM